MKRSGVLLALVLLVQTPLGCGDEGEGDQGNDQDAGQEEDPPSTLSTGAVCDDKLSYANDIAPLMTKYCTRCHASTLLSSARMGAPAERNFDSEAGIRAAYKEIDAMAGSGPILTNIVMPPSDPRPTIAERATLSRYLACQR